MRLALRLRVALVYAALLILVIGGLSLFIWFSVRETDPALGTQLWFAAAAAALLSTGLAFILASLTTKPLQQLSRRVLKLATSSGAARDESIHWDELTQLERAFGLLETQLHAQVEALTNERGTLSSVLNAMTDGVVILDTESKILLMNPAVERMFNVNSDEAMGQTLIEVLRHHQLVELWQKCAETKEPQVATI